MLKMMITETMSLSDRVLLGGKPTEFTDLPSSVNLSGTIHKVIGLSQGVRAPYISLEVAKVNQFDYDSLRGTTIEA